MFSITINYTKAQTEFSNWETNGQFMHDEVRLLDNVNHRVLVFFAVDPEHEIVDEIVKELQNFGLEIVK